MRVFILTSIALLGRHVNGFSPSSQQAATCTSTKLFGDISHAGGPTRSKPMSAEELKAQMGIEDSAPPPKLFSDSLYDDMQQTLVLLEKRIAQGPGSLSMLEVEELSSQTQRIAVEMRESEGNRVSGLGSAQAAAAPIAQSPTVPGAEIVKSKEIFDRSEDEGPAWDGTGGFGLSKGTRNTYVIPGMDEMSPEEYRKALQDSVIERQRARKSSGTTGNRATWDYLNNLTGETGVLKGDEDVEQP